MADQDPVFQIQRVYLKEASLEQPNSPAILLEQEQPNVDIQLGVEASPVAEGEMDGSKIHGGGWNNSARLHGVLTSGRA